MSAPARKVVHSDIKPENPPERAAHFLDAPNMPWEKTKFPGTQIKVLYQRDYLHLLVKYGLEPPSQLSGAPANRCQALSRLS